MLAYEVYWRNPEGEYTMIGVLPERRRNPIRITRQSVTNWGIMILGNDVDSRNIFFKRIKIESFSDRILWYQMSDHPINV